MRKKIEKIALILTAAGTVAIDPFIQSAKDVDINYERDERSAVNGITAFFEIIGLENEKETWRPAHEKEENKS